MGATKNLDTDLSLLLLEYGAEPDIVNSQDATALVNLIRSMNLLNCKAKHKVAEELLKHGANPNHYVHSTYYGQPGLIVYNYKIPPIVAAIYNNDVELVRLLIEYGAELKKPVRSTQYGTMYPLDFALKWNRLEIINLLILHGAFKEI